MDERPVLDAHQVEHLAIEGTKRIVNEKANDEVQVAGKLEIMNIGKRSDQRVNLSIVGKLVIGNDRIVIEILTIVVELVNMNGINQPTDWIVVYGLEMLEKDPLQVIQLCQVNGDE